MKNDHGDYGFQSWASWKIGCNTDLDDFRSDNVLADRDGTVLQRLEDLKQTITPIADWILTDKDDFDVADADADTDRWNIGYFSGAAGGSADINTTTSGHLYILADYNVAGAECYFVSHATPFYADNFIVTEDMDCTWGTTNSATPKAIGLVFSKGTSWDANNYIIIERHKGTGVDRIQVRYNLNGAGEVTDNTAGNITDNAIALKIERWDQTWRLYYSLAQNPDEEWVLAAQIEDSSDYMTNEVTFYHSVFNGAAGDANETAQGDFDFFRYYVGAGGGSQFLVGTYNSDWVTPDIDGNLFERDEATLKAIQIVDAGGTGFEEDGTGATLYKTLIAYEGLTTSAGTNCTIVDTVLTAKSANDLLGCQVIMLEGNNAGQARTIKAFDGTSTITVEPEWLTTTSDASAYVILTKQGNYHVIASGDFTTDSATVPADTGRGEASSYFDGQILMPLTGNCAFQPRKIVNFNATGDVFTLDAQHPFTTTPGTVAYTILATDPSNLIPSVDATTNTTSAHAVGGKADTASYVGNNEDSLVSYAKGTIASITAGAQMSIQLNNQTARTNLEQILEDFFTVWGMNGTDVFDPTVHGVSCTTLEQYLDELGEKLETIQPDTTSLATIYDEVHANLDMAETDATTTTLDETEQTLYEESDTRPFDFVGGYSDLSSQADGDIVRFRIYTKAKSGGTYRKITQDGNWTFIDSQADPACVEFDSHSAMYGFKVTVEHILAAAPFDIDSTFYDGKAGN